MLDGIVTDKATGAASIQARQFFADEELLIGCDFWNFICHSDQGYRWVLDAYRESAHLITAALDSIKHTYLDAPPASAETDAEA